MLSSSRVRERALRLQCEVSAAGNSPLIRLARSRPPSHPTEVLKLVLSVGLALREVVSSTSRNSGYSVIGEEKEEDEQDVGHTGSTGIFASSTLLHAVFSRDLYKMALPALLFLIQNTLM